MKSKLQKKQDELDQVQKKFTEHVVRCDAQLLIIKNHMNMVGEFRRIYGNMALECIEFDNAIHELTVELNEMLKPKTNNTQENEG